MAEAPAGGAFDLMAQRSVCLGKCFNVFDYQIKYRQVITQAFRLETSV
jgi:hypothetical protein